MLVEIQKTEMREICLDKVLHTKLGDSIYTRFTPVNDKIHVLRFNTSSFFNLESRSKIYDCELEILYLTGLYVKEINEEEFNAILQKLLLENI